MQKILIKGDQPLKGIVTISGSKNASLPILAATLLTNEECIIKNIPDLDDVRTLIEILKKLGMDIRRREDGAIITKVIDESEFTAPYELVRKMRASVCVLGPLLAKRKKSKVSLPGGCVIGVRPIDLHIKGIKQLGAEVEVENGYVTAKANELNGKEIFLGGAFGSSVLGTANVMMVATLAKGTTIIENAACEPEVQDLANFLIAMGAKINGVGSPRIEIEGVDSLKGVKEYEVIPDRIEAGTFIIAGAMTEGNIKIHNVVFKHLSALLDKFEELGINFNRDLSKNIIEVTGGINYNSTDITTLPYPGFPTDLQAQFTAMLCLAKGISIVTEKIYPDRFMHVPELNRMGANIRKEGSSAIIQGVPYLTGAPVMASDLRASAALVLAGLVSKNETIIDRIYHLDRGYEKLDVKLQGLGAKIERIEYPD